MAAVQQNVTYKTELMPGDIIEIRSHPLSVCDTVVVLVHEMRNAERDGIAAVCELTCVHMDRAARRSCPFPSPIRAAAETMIAVSG